MTRPRKNVIDYFPHDCRTGKTIAILEKRFKNDGYSCWFKILELMGQTENHYYDCSEDLNWEFLKAKTLIDDDAKVRDILSLMATLGAIDKELWVNYSILWSDNFVKGLDSVYQKRSAELPTKPSFYTPESHTPMVSVTETPHNGISDDGNPQSKVKESKGEESIGEYISIPNGILVGKGADDDTQKCPHQDIISLYHQTLPSLTKVQVWNANRQKMLRQRWAEDKTRQSLKWWEDYFNIVLNSPFLLGDNDSSWSVDLEWLVRPTNMPKVIEGKYLKKKKLKNLASVNQALRMVDEGKI